MATPPASKTHRRGSDPVQAATLVLLSHETLPVDSLITSTRYIRKLLGNSLSSNAFGTDASQIIEDSALVHRLVQLLSHQNGLLCYEAVWALTNIAAGESKHTRIVVEAGAMPPMMNLVLKARQQDDSALLETALWGLSNIAGDGCTFRTALIDLGFVDVIVDCLKSANDPKVLRTSLWGLGNIFKPLKSDADDNRFTKLSLPVFDRIFGEVPFPPMVIAEAGFTMDFMMQFEPEVITVVLEKYGSRMIDHVVNSENARVLGGLLRAIGNFSLIRQGDIALLKHPHLLSRCKELIWHEQQGIGRLTLWMLSNLAAGPIESVEVISKSNILPTICTVLMTEESVTPEMIKEATWIIDNILMPLKSGEDLTKSIIDQGIMVALVNVMKRNTIFSEVSEIALAAIEKVIELGQDGYYNDYVEHFQTLGLDRIFREILHEPYLKLSVHQQILEICISHFEDDML